MTILKPLNLKMYGFGIPEQKEYALKNISIKINAREKWSIVGENGSWKVNVYQAAGKAI